MRAALVRSGYLLETRVAALLRETGFEVTTSPAYSDPATGRSREIDIHAHGFSHDIDPREMEDRIWADLLIECVNPPRPLVFFPAHPPDEWDSGLQRVKIAGPPTQQPQSDFRYNWYWLLREIRATECHHYFQPGTYATQYCSFDKKKSGGGKGEWFAQHREQDYEALRSLIAATDHMTRYQHQHMDEQYPWLQLAFFFPVVVVHGELLLATPTKRSVSLSRTEHVRLHWARSEGQEHHRYLIDVVTEKHLLAYLGTVRTTIDGFANRLKERMPAVFIDAIERAKEFRAGKPRDSSSPVPASAYELARVELEEYAAL